MGLILDEVLRRALENHGSDVFIVPGSPIMTKSSGRLIQISEEKMLPPDVDLQGLFYNGVDLWEETRTDYSVNGVTFKDVAGVALKKIEFLDIDEEECLAGITARPFLRIADGADTTQVYARRQKSRIVFLN